MSALGERPGSKLRAGRGHDDERVWAEGMRRVSARQYAEDRADLNVRSWLGLIQLAPTMDGPPRYPSGFVSHAHAHARLSTQGIGMQQVKSVSGSVSHDRVRHGT